MQLEAARETPRFLLPRFQRGGAGFPHVGHLMTPVAWESMAKQAKQLDFLELWKTNLLIGFWGNRNENMDLGRRIIFDKRLLV
jgi:hypothetical protein